jgi:hypothetical protein
LKRLRSLEKQPAPAADDEPELIADMDSSEPTKIGLPTMRPTAVGRSLATESPGQQMVVHPESMRGTMFGHSVHLPDLPPEGEETPSGPIYVPPKPNQTMQATQMVPYTNRAPTYPGSQEYPAEAQPFHPRVVADDAEVRTQTIPPLGRRAYVRAIGAIVGLMVIAGGAYTWTRYQVGDPTETQVPAATTAAPATADPATATNQPAPAVVPAPPSTGTPSAGTAAAAPPTAAAPSPAAAAPSPAAAAPSPAAAAPSRAAAAPPSPASDPPVRETPPRARPAAAARVPELARPAAAPAPVHEPIRPHRRGAHDEHRRGSATAESATEAPPELPAAKPAAAKKRSLIDDDPDATLPPSSAE